MATSIKLYGSKATKFETIKAQIEEQWGYTPTNPEVIGVLMASMKTLLLGLSSLWLLSQETLTGELPYLTAHLMPF